MTNAERQFCDFQHDLKEGAAAGQGRAGSFMFHLWRAIAAADPRNLELLYDAFDDQVNVWKRYHREGEPFVAQLMERYNRGE